MLRLVGAGLPAQSGMLVLLVLAITAARAGEVRFTISNPAALPVAVGFHLVKVELPAVRMGLLTLAARSCEQVENR